MGFHRGKGFAAFSWITRGAKVPVPWSKRSSSAGMKRKVARRQQSRPRPVVRPRSRMPGKGAMASARKASAVVTLPATTPGPVLISASRSARALERPRWRSSR